MTKKLIKKKEPWKIQGSPFFKKAF